MTDHSRKRVLVGYGIDVDAVSGHINKTDGSPADLTSVSRGGFMDIHMSKYDLTSFLYRATPNLTLSRAFICTLSPAVVYMGHRYHDRLDETQLEAVLEETIKCHEAFTGTKPKGFTAPAWKVGPHLIKTLEDHGILYDHSLMHDDFHAYYAPYAEEFTTTDYANPADSWMKPMKRGESSSVVEIPASWVIDDWPPFNPDPGRPGAQGYVPPESVFQSWRDSFEYCYERYDKFIFPISIHPQVSGRPHILVQHSRLIDWINTHEGVEWCTFAQMAEEFRAGNLD
ncbi:hypothetical protein MMC25_002903 [Agyrium rufum]|nr:hypothetical protein [Agyrium rufum]